MKLKPQVNPHFLDYREYLDDLDIKCFFLFSFSVNLFKVIGWLFATLAVMTMANDRFERIKERIKERIRITPEPKKHAFSGAFSKMDTYHKDHLIYFTSGETLESPLEELPRVYLRPERSLAEEPCLSTIEWSSIINKVKKKGLFLIDQQISVGSYDPPVSPYSVGLYFLQNRSSIWERFFLSTAVMFIIPASNPI